MKKCVCGVSVDSPVSVRIAYNSVFPVRITRITKIALDFSSSVRLCAVILDHSDHQVIIRHYIIQSLLFSCAEATEYRKLASSQKDAEVPLIQAYSFAGRQRKIDQAVIHTLVAHWTPYADSF